MFNDLLNLFKKRFKVGIISYYYPFEKPSTSGVGIHVYNLVTNLSKLGCEVHVFTFSDMKKSAKTIYVGEGKIIIHFINAETSYEITDSVVAKRIKYSIFQNKVLDEIGLEHNRRSFDVLHTHGWLTSSAFILKYLYRVPWIHTVHALERNRLASMSEEERKLFRLTSWIEDTIADSDRLIAVSQDTSKQLVMAFGEKVIKKIEVIPNGVDINMFKPDRKIRNSVLCVTRFSKEKGIELLPSIIDKILSKSKTYKFTLVAQKTTIPTLKHIQEELLNLKKKYDLQFNWVDYPIMPVQLSEYYSSSEIYVQPSFYETFGLCILEAMASGNVTVSSRVGGIPEVVGDAGFLVKPNAGEISRAVVALLKNRPKLSKYKLLSLERAKKFGWPDIAQKTFEVYKEMVEKRKR